MKTNVSIKFNSIEEYREIEKKLIELGYKLSIDNKIRKGFILINNKDKRFGKLKVIFNGGVMHYNSLQEFLNN